MMRPSSSCSGCTRVIQPRRRVSLSAASVLSFSRYARAHAQPGSPCGRGRGEAVGLAARDLREAIAGRDVHDLAGVPVRHLADRPRPRGLHLHQRGVPLVGEDGRPQQPESRGAVDEQGGVGVGVAGRVGQPGRRRPGRRALALPGAEQFDVVGRALAGAVEPGHQQVAVRMLDDARGVVVPVLHREQQFRAVTAPRAAGACAATPATAATSAARMPAFTPRCIGITFAVHRCRPAGRLTLPRTACSRARR